MKNPPKYLSKFNTVLFAVSLAFGLVPVLRAQVQTQSQAQTQADSVSQASGETLRRLQDLEREVTILQMEVVKLKNSESRDMSESGTPGMRAAFLEQPVMQQAPPESTPAAAAAQEPARTAIARPLGPTSFGGFVDTYYGFNFNHPSSLMSGVRFFDANTNQFGLNMIELTVDKAPDATAGEAGRTGYHVSLGFGQAINAVNGSEPVVGVGFAQYLKEAYFSYLARVGKGLQIEVGKFVTTAGEEVIETKDNWNYSRSLLFYYAKPYYHFGVRANYRFNDKFSAQGSITNGWNDVVDFSSAKTYGVSSTWNPTKPWSLTETYYVGPQPESGNFANTRDRRHLSDTVITYSPTSKWAFVVNGDYGREYRSYATPPGNVVDWWGMAGYTKYGWSDKNNFAVRYEYYGDPHGDTVFGLSPYAGLREHAQEVTTTFTHMLASSLMTRFEYRYDFASRPLFQKGGIPFEVKEQHTLALGMVYIFDSHGGK
jgi:Putative beta-barrel porin-2, OmpL-like. bbp2